MNVLPPAETPRPIPDEAISRSSAGLIRQAAIIGVLGLLVILVWQVISPFATGIVWGAIVATATYPALLKIEAYLGGKRWAGVLVLVSAIAVFLLLPIVLGVSALQEHGDTLVRVVYQYAMEFATTPPSWVVDLPFVGARIVAWLKTAADAVQAGGGANLVGGASRWLFSQIGVVGGMFFQVVVALIALATLLGRAEAVGSIIRGLAASVGGANGGHLVAVATKAVRAVSLGVVLTAVLQAALTWISLVVVGAPFAPLLSFIAFLLTLAQLGVAFVLLPVALWLYTSGDTGWAVALVVWLFGVVNMVDNVTKPMFIKRGMSIPLELVFLGVIGGLLSMGLVGIFLGPVIIALASELLTAWAADSSPSA